MSRKSVLIILIVLGISSIIAYYRLPTAKATEIIWKEGHITADEVWFYIPNTVYRVIGDVYVDLGVTLTIEPNVIVQFADGFSLFVEGSLNASGTKESIIAFTSSRLEPSSGLWQTIAFKSATGMFLLKHCKVEYAVNGLTIESNRLSIIEYSIFQNNSDAGIRVIGDSQASIQNNVIERNGRGLTLESAASGIILEGNNITQNYGNGVCNYHYANHNITILSNTISDNEGYGIYLYTRTTSGHLYDISIIQNNITSNDDDGITFYGYLDTVYLNDISISGNTVSFNNGHGIYLRTYVDYGEQAHIYNVEISGNIASSNGKSGVYIESEARYSYVPAYIYNTTIFGNIVSSNQDCGIKLIATKHFSTVAYDVSIFSNFVSANNYGMYFSTVVTNLTQNSVAYNSYGIHYAGTTGNLAEDNDIYDNVLFGMYVASSVDAEYNYWGHSSGPYHESLNPTAEGNAANGDGTDLDFIPFLTMPVRSLNERPVAHLVVDNSEPLYNETVIFDGSGSTDDGRIDYYLFDFGDGTNSSWTTLPVVTHKYAEEREYNATLIVMDDFGVTSLDGDLVYVEITVVPEFPSMLILPLFMLATLLAAIVYRRKSKD